MKIDKVRFMEDGLKVLSPLEADVLNILWKKESAKVRELYNVLKKERKVALTSIAVVLDRLHQKKLVKRKIESCRGGYYYIYSPRIEKLGFERSIMENTVNKLIDTFGSSAVAYFNERFSEKRKSVKSSTPP